MSQDQEMARRLHESFRASDVKKACNAKLPKCSPSSVIVSSASASKKSAAGKKKTRAVAQPQSNSQKKAMAVVRASGDRIRKANATVPASRDQLEVMQQSEKFLGSGAAEYQQWLASHGLQDLRGVKMTKRFVGHGDFEGTAILPPSPRIIDGTLTAYADTHHPYCVRYSDGDIAPISLKELTKSAQNYSTRREAGKIDTTESNFLAALSGANLQRTQKPAMAARKYATSSLADLDMWEEARSIQQQGSCGAEEESSDDLRQAATMLLDARSHFSSSPVTSDVDFEQNTTSNRKWSTGPEKKELTAWGPRRGRSSPHKPKAASRKPNQGAQDVDFLRTASALLLLAAAKSKGPMPQ